MVARKSSKALTKADVRQVVESLELEFDKYEPRVSASFGTSWREAALAATRAEVPRIDNPRSSSQSSSSSSSLWRLKSVELHHALMKKNPVLPRSSVLRNSSGRYAEDILVPGGCPSASNPTGKREAKRAHLPAVKPADLETYVTTAKHVCVACVRADDRACRVAETIAESARFLSTDDVGIVKCEMSVSTHVAERYGVRAIPAFLVFCDGRLAYRGAVGGRAVRVDAPSFRILYVEPAFKDQLWSERILRKMRFSWDLCLDASQAQARRRAQQRPYDLVLASSELGPDDCLALDRLLAKDKTPICGLATLSGEEGASAKLKAAWTGRRNGISFDLATLLPPHLAAVATVAMTKPIKPSAIDDLVDYLRTTSASQRQQRTRLPQQAETYVYKGLTPHSLLEQIQTAIKAAQTGARLVDATTFTKPAFDLQHTGRKFTRPTGDVSLSSLINVDY